MYLILDQSASSLFYSLEIAYVEKHIFNGVVESTSKTEISAINWNKVKAKFVNVDILRFKRFNVIQILTPWMLKKEKLLLQWMKWEVNEVSTP